jgi:hypothetical protein
MPIGAEGRRTKRTTMDEKTLKKIAKRVKVKKRAQSQTARRRTRLAARADKGQMAPDIYRAKKGAKGGAAGDKTGGEYTLKKYSYNEFEYGDPLKSESKSATTSRRKQTRLKAQGLAEKKAKTKNKSIFVIVD